MSRKGILLLTKPGGRYNIVYTVPFGCPRPDENRGEGEECMWKLIVRRVVVFVAQLVWEIIAGQVRSAAAPITAARKACDTVLAREGDGAANGKEKRG